MCYNGLKTKEVIHYEIIAVFDDKDYDENWSRFTRRAVRAVIIKITNCFGQV